MKASQIDLCYRATYIRAYRLRHPRRTRMRILFALILVISICPIGAWSMRHVLATENEYELTNLDNRYEDEGNHPTELYSALTTLTSQSYDIEYLSNTSTENPYGGDDSIDDIEPVSEMMESDDAVEEFSEDSENAAEYMQTSEEVDVLNSQEYEPVQEVPHIDMTVDTSDALLEYFTEDELEFIYRVVEAEVTGTSYRYDGKYVNEDEMLMSKIRVAQVFLNRANNTERFSHVTTLYEACAEPGASSTVLSGRYLRVEVTDLTKEAVAIAMNPETEDYTDGALFFLADGATYCKYGDYLFTDAVGHSFFK